MDGSAAAALTQGEFRSPDMLKICTGNTQYKDSDSGKMVREEASNLSTGKHKQDANMTEASRRDDLADLKARNVPIEASHEQSDNKDMEWKCIPVIDDYVDRTTGNTPRIRPFEFARNCNRGCTGCDKAHTPAPSDQRPPSAAHVSAGDYEHHMMLRSNYYDYIDMPALEPLDYDDAGAFEAAMPRSTLGFGEPHHGKCDCDACGGRIKAETGRLRVAGDIVGTDARTISIGLNSVPYDPIGKLYRRSVTHDLTDAHIEAVAAHRALHVPGQYPGSKKARQVMYSAEKQAVGFRDLMCRCVPCARNSWSECSLAALTGGEPTWFQDGSGVRRRVVVVEADADKAIDAAEDELQAERPEHGYEIEVPSPIPDDRCIRVALSGGRHSDLVIPVGYMPGATIWLTAEGRIPSGAAGPGPDDDGGGLLDGDNDQSNDAEDGSDAAQSMVLSAGDMVALVHNDPEYEDFEYYVLLVTVAATSADDEVDGFFLEPQSGESGPGIYEADRGNPARVQMLSIMLSGGSGLPRRACLERLTQAEEGGLLTARLSADEHLRLVSTV